MATYISKNTPEERGKAVESRGRFIGEVRATGVPVAFHVHDCEPGYSPPRYHVSDHLPVGEIGTGGFRRIAGYLARSAGTLEVLPVADPQGAVLTARRCASLPNMQPPRGIRERQEMYDGRVMTHTLAAMAESRRILDRVIADSQDAVLLRPTACTGSGLRCTRYRAWGSRVSPPARRYTR